jgi:hypothetical protein
VPDLPPDRDLLAPASIPASLWLALLRDDLRRDPVTARRAALVSLIWCEAFLSKEGLMARVEAVLGRGCFGRAAEATFQRDMRAIKQALATTNHQLKFARRSGSTGYYIQDRPPLEPEFAAHVRAAMAEVDAHQIEIQKRLAPAARVRQAGQLSDGLRRMAVRRWQTRKPDLPLASAHREVMRRYDQLGG